MASTADVASSSQNGLTPAQRLQAEHAAVDNHQPTIEDVQDEEDIAHPPPSSSAAAHQSVDTEISMVNGGAMSGKVLGKQRATDGTVSDVSQQVKNKIPALEVHSEEAFPSLGPAKAAPVASTWGSRPASALANGLSSNAASGRSAPGYSPARTPNSRPAPGVSLPGRYTEDMRMPTNQLRTDLKRPIGDLLKDINRKAKAKVEMRRAGGYVIFQGSGPNVESVQDILKEIAAQLGQKQHVVVPIPSSLRAHIIGKAGSTIQAISKKSGARVQMPRPVAGAEDDEDTVNVEIEGSPMAVAMAKHEIENIINSRTSTVNLRLKDIPAEFFPFIAGPHNSRISALEEGRDVRVKVPHYHTWQNQAPSADHPSNLTPQEGLAIQIAGEREAAKQVQAEIERHLRELQSQLSINQVPIEQSRHQFIVGRGNSLHDFLNETGCTIVLPPSSEDNEMITIIGPQGHIDRAVDKAMDLASSMHMQKVDFSKQYPGSREHAETHAHNLARYLRQRRALEQYEKQYDAQVVPESAGQWQIYSRDPRSAMRARNDVMNLVSGHPPARFRNVEVPPFYQRGIRQQHAKPLREQHGVHLMTPEDPESPQIVLVFEGPGSAEDYAFPQKQPSAAENAEFERQLQAAEAYLLGLIGEQQQIQDRSIDAPSKYREKLQRYVTRQGEQEAEQRYPVEFPGLHGAASSAGQNFPLRFRGPQTAVDDYEQKLRAFIDEQIRDEAERDYTISFDFPQKFANILIGKQGSNVQKLREEFDVEIQVNDGQVEIKGPQAKANAAKSHILAMARKLEDETTHVLKISPKFHGQLVGPKGANVLRLQDRYNVRIQFPRNSAEDTPEDASDAGGPRRRAQAADEVVIKGSKKNADEARDELWNLYTYTQDISHTATVSVAQAQIPSLIGQGGSALQSLRESTGAEIDIPGRDAVDASGRVEVKIKGKKQNVENAKKIIQERVKTFDDTVSKNIEVDRKHHRALIGSGGDNIRQIVLAAGGSGDARELNRMVQIPKADNPSNNISVEGDPAVVERIIEAIQSFVNHRESQVTETVEVAPGRHGALIGRGGETRKAIESEHNITMLIPSTNVTGPARSLIKLSGSPADVARARERILAMTKESEGTQIDMPHRLHHAVADTNGNIFQSLRRDLRVNVDHAGQQKPPRPAPPAKNSKTQSNMPLITDDAPSSGNSLDPEANHQWDISDLLSSASSSSEDANATIPWILRGPDAASIQRAREQIEAAMAQARESVTGYLVLPDPKTYRYVIGQGGSTVNTIRRETGAKVDVPKAGAGREAIEIVGTRSQVEAAKEMILAAVVQGLEGRPTR